MLVLYLLFTFTLVLLIFFAIRFVVIQNFAEVLLAQLVLPVIFFDVASGLVAHEDRQYQDAQGSDDPQPDFESDTPRAPVGVTLATNAAARCAHCITIAGEPIAPIVLVRLTRVDASCSDIRVCCILKVRQPRSTVVFCLCQIFHFIK